MRTARGPFADRSPNGCRRRRLTKPVRAEEMHARLPLAGRLTNADGDVTSRIHRRHSSQTVKRGDRDHPGRSGVRAVEYLARNAGRVVDERSSARTWGREPRAIAPTLEVYINRAAQVDDGQRATHSHAQWRG